MFRAIWSPASFVRRPFFSIFQIDLRQDREICLTGCNAVDSLRFGLFLHLLLQGSGVISHSCQMQESIDFQRFFSQHLHFPLVLNTFYLRLAESLSKLTCIVFNECSGCAPMLELCCIKLPLMSVLISREKK